MKKRILFVGESPMGCSGNSNMMRAILGQVNKDEYLPAVYAIGTQSYLKTDLFQPPPFAIIPADGLPQDRFNGPKLIRLVKELPIDAIVFVGIDIWTYAGIYDQFMGIKGQKKFKSAFIFPYDILELREDWLQWINLHDYPCVYSQYGYNMLRDRVPNLRYYRPPLFGSQLFKVHDEQTKSEIRRKYFPTTGDGFLFGWVGNNQFRKDPQKILRAFYEVKKELPNSYLYIHTNMQQGVFNMVQYSIDIGIKSGDIIAKGGDIDGWHPLGQMVDIYNSLDTLVNCSLQEGLSWTLLEAMLCGCPIIASDTTAQKELVRGVGLPVPITEPALMPVYTKGGQSWIDAKACSVKDLKAAMIKMATDDKFRKHCRERGIEKAQSWVKGVSDINELLSDACGTKGVPLGKKAPEIINKVIFAQHSAAGDVLMTTKCFKGIKEMFKLPLVYMTQRQFVDIVKGNPYLDEVIEWDEREFGKYAFRLNPHADRILPGHWGRNCNTILSDFYWKLLNVKPEPIFIELKNPGFELDSMGKKICVVHTTGGDPTFRTYQYMQTVCKAIDDRYLTIQTGGPKDYPAGARVDLRGKLSYRESAWLMSQAQLSINVDSFVSHLAGALGISQIVLFGSGNAFVVRPDQTKGELVCLVPDYIRDCPGLGPCSASIRDCPAPCTGVHNPKTILRHIKGLEERNMIRPRGEHETACYSFQYVQ